jgi:hypothetical protein
MAAAITFVLYGAAGMLLGLSTRRLELGGALYVLAMLGVIIFGNTIIWFSGKPGCRGLKLSCKPPSPNGTARPSRA